MVGDENMRRVEHWLLLESIDYHWREHLTAIDDLRQSIGLQAYAQVDPLVAFKREGHDMYTQLLENIRQQVARTVFKVRINQQQQPRRRRQWSRHRTGRTATEHSRPPRSRGRRGGARAAHARTRRGQPPTDEHRRRWRRSRADGDRGPPEDRPQRPVLLRQREEVQEVPRSGRVTASG
jgi:preprotein translocase subunit SecA